VTSNNQESEVDNGQYVASAVFYLLPEEW
jgi:hypothetical protein